MMKRLILCFLCLVFLFSGCSVGENINATTDPEVTQNNNTVNEENFVGVWVTYAELSAKNHTEESYREYIKSLFKSFSDKGINNVFFHVRPFADAMYKSDIFPTSEFGTDEFDILKLATEEAETFSLKIHAWINPYRVSNDLNGEKPFDFAVQIGNGIYLDPSDNKSKALILDGIREILDNYNVDGIHFDDYFYPKDCGDFDRENFIAYKAEGGKLNLADFRREQVNALVSSAYAITKSYGKIFSISPAGDVEADYSEHYADVALWCKGGFCDMIIPQLYFGFLNETMPFSELLDEWKKLTDKNEVQLVIGLAVYKCGEEDVYAGEGKYEWQENNDIIERQINEIKEKDLSGYVFFSASYLDKLKKQ